MTIYLALDELPGFTLGAGTGAARIAAISADLTTLVQVVADLPNSGSYTIGTTVQTIDETDDSKWDDNCIPGWYWSAGVVQKTRPLTVAQRLDAGIRTLKAVVQREEREWELVLARESFAPQFDSGHLWSDDIMHAIIKPNIRLQVILWTTAKATPNAANVGLAEGSLAFFEAAAGYGVRQIYASGDKSVWRPLRDGLVAAGYDIDTGGIRSIGATPIRRAVTYPTGESVATWDAISAVESL